MLKPLFLLVAAASMLAGVSAIAQVPEIRTSGSVAYIAGGIGEGEVKAIRDQAASFSALVEFVEVEQGQMHGDWTADIAVNVLSGGQLIATLQAPGPLLLLRLAPGRYTLEAIHGDVKLSKVIEIKPRGALVRERFIWRVPQGSLGADLKNR
jgi:hypothetical protein